MMMKDSDEMVKNDGDIMRYHLERQLDTSHLAAHGSPSSRTHRGS